MAEKKNKQETKKETPKKEETKRELYSTKTLLEVVDEVMTKHYKGYEDLGMKNITNQVRKIL